MADALSTCVVFDYPEHLPHLCSSQFTTRRLGEPLNIVISSQSDPYVLEESGLRDYSKSVFSPGALAEFAKRKR